MSADRGDALLRGWRLRVGVRPLAPVTTAVGVLAELGARAAAHASCEPAELELRAPDGRTSRVTLAGWRGERALRDELDRTGSSSLAPAARVLQAYGGLRLAESALDPEGPGVLSTDGLVAELLPTAAAGPSPAEPVLLEGDDGWLVARWRDEGERGLFEALVLESRASSVDDIAAVAREARLLVAPVRPPRASRAGAVYSGRLRGSKPRVRRPRVVDWTALWAGPSATRRLLASGAQVTRVEHPRRRDGLLGWQGGERWWKELNGEKELALLDAREPEDWEQLLDLVAGADILVTAMTPRALASLGIDDRLRERQAPGLLHVELVGLDAPLSDCPALGEHAAAEAGLLWRGAGLPPARPYPWPDALLDAATTLACRGWLASPRRRGGRIRLTLEGVARTAVPADAPVPAQGIAPRELIV